MVARTSRNVNIHGGQFDSIIILQNPGMTFTNLQTNTIK